ncbi:MAG: putative Ig domain-containing protein [Balneolaceae bacterium]
MKNIYSLFVLCFLSFLITEYADAQWTQDFRDQMDISDIVDIESSPSHLYVLSESEGLVVFRAHSDSLQYLYSSTGMQRRGDRMEADIRFAYLYGQGRRLTVIEPTSVLGVYSSTVLPEAPKSTQRMGTNLYIAMGETGLGSLSLETPEAVDTSPEMVDQGRFRNSSVQHLVTDNHRLLYVLSDNRNIDIYQSDSEEESLRHEEQVQLNQSIEKIFLTDDELIGTDSEGNIYMIDSDGQTRTLATVEEPVHKLNIWDGYIAVRTISGKIWIGEVDEELNLWKEEESAGNHFTVVENNFYLSEFNTISPVIYADSRESENNSEESASEEFNLKSISNVTLPFPKPLILPIELESSQYNIEDISLSYQGSVDNARIRGNTFFWQPNANQTGRQQFTITATTIGGKSTSTQFSVDLRPFNAPPRFTPSRTISVVAEEDFQLEIEAFDPDGFNTDLIRYLGVDLPNGANLNEQTGEFNWEPSIRQVGTHSFQVIATDQFGAAASQNYELRVIEVDEDFDEETQEVQN